jgi:glycopeptide antibiotics resistance protein
MTAESEKNVIGWVLRRLYGGALRLTVFRPHLFEADLFARGSISLIPLQNYLELLGEGRYLYALYLFGGNIAWFMPFGFLLPYLTGQPKKAGEILLVGFLLSLVIEFLQFGLGTGESELDDLLLNTLGALLGFLIHRAFVRRKARKAGRVTGGRDASEV